jgi:hypothetical protein
MDGRLTHLEATFGGSDDVRPTELILVDLDIRQGIFGSFRFGDGGTDDVVWVEEDGE